MEREDKAKQNKVINYISVAKGIIISSISIHAAQRRRENWSFQGLTLAHTHSGTELDFMYSLLVPPFKGSPISASKVQQRVDDVMILSCDALLQATPSSPLFSQADQEFSFFFSS